MTVQTTHDMILFQSTGGTESGGGEKWQVWVSAAGQGHDPAECEGATVWDQQHRQWGTVEKPAQSQWTNRLVIIQSVPTASTHFFWQQLSLILSALVLSRERDAKWEGTEFLTAVLAPMIRILVLSLLNCKTLLAIQLYFSDALNQWFNRV